MWHVVIGKYCDWYIVYVSVNCIDDTYRNVYTQWYTGLSCFLVTWQSAEGGHVHLFSCSLMTVTEKNWYQSLHSVAYRFGNQKVAKVNPEPISIKVAFIRHLYLIWPPSISSVIWPACFVALHWTGYVLWLSRMVLFSCFDSHKLPFTYSLCKAQEYCGSPILKLPHHSSVNCLGGGSISW